ncbi:MAG TPA: hypothetical protein VH414_20445 [Lichenihabitans sp.]|jgi:hypothetical protein|nr:hypothetical protein [Lichenihabitans sp.]
MIKPLIKRKDSVFGVDLKAAATLARRRMPAVPFAFFSLVRRSSVGLAARSAARAATLGCRPDAMVDRLGALTRI